jgi:uncharacterized protein
VVDLGSVTAGRFCWVDLAATDAARATDFYRQLLGWTSHEERANGGVFTRLQLAGHDVGSVYQLKRAHVERGVQSHWTPYIRIDDVEAAAQSVVALGGEIVVRPIVVAGIARIALIADPVGAHVGLWEPVDPNGMGTSHA